MIDTAFPSIGFLYQHNGQEEPVPASLNFDTESGVRVEVPVEPRCVDTYWHWFHHGERRAPSSLVFQDNQASFHLVNCKGAGFAGQSGPHPRGVGYLTADYIIKDIDRHMGDFEGVQRLQSQIAGLHEFTGWQTSQTDIDSDADGLAKKMTVTAELPERIAVGTINDFDVSIQPHWSGGDEQPGLVTIHSTTWIETHSSSRQSIQEHQEIHRILRDLIALAYWQPADFIDHRINRDDRPRLTWSRDVIPGVAWRPVYTIRPLRSHNRRSETTTVPAVNLAKLGTSGLRRWFDTHSQLNRALNPLLGLLFAEQATIDVAVMQTGVAMEAYGYIAAVNSGVLEGSAASRSYYARLIAAAGELPFDLENLVSGGLEDWARKAADAYNGTKHANRALPDGQESALIASTLIIILRILILKHLGLSNDALAEAKEFSTPWWQLRQMYRQLNSQGD